MTKPRQGPWTLGVRLPDADADRAERRRFVRDLNARSAVVTALLLVLAIAVGAADWIIMFLGVALLAVLIDVAWLTHRLPNDRDAAA